MLFRLFNHFLSLPVRRGTDLVRRRSVRLAAIVLLALGGATRSEAGTAANPPKRARVQQAPAPTPTMIISKAPHLVAVGPVGIYVKPVAGPHFRQAPLLPKPPARKPDAEARPALEPAGAGPKEPSAFSPDAAPVLIPKEQPPEAPVPAKTEEPKESVLTPAARAEQELKDAVIYFETPVGPRGSQVSVPAVVPLTSPTSGTQPESRANYRKEKE